MYEWTDPDTNEVYEIMYNVTQFESEGPEHFVWRKKTWENAPWSELPPFISHQDMRKIEDHFFGPTKGWQHGIPASIVSDIERIDVALDTLGDVEEAGKKLDFDHPHADQIAIVADALHDARSSLLYLSRKMSERGW